MDVRTGQALRDILKDKTLLKDKSYIDGRWVKGTATIEVTNPVNGEVMVEIPFRCRND
jgi:succinate-semialdehyde dehydrogenase / glutarate-semialdehyde dehydrogenase